MFDHHGLDGFKVIKICRTLRMKDTQFPGLMSLLTGPKKKNGLL